MLYNPPAAGLLPGMLTGRLWVFPVSDIIVDSGLQERFQDISG
jgi:hypothetical protein